MVAFEIHLEIESMGPPDEFDVRGEEKRQIKFSPLRFVS